VSAIANTARIHRVRVEPAGFDAALRFYQEGLGLGDLRLWSAPPAVKRGATLTADDGTWVELLAADSVARPEPGDRIADVSLAYQDVAAAFARALDAGASPVREPSSGGGALLQGPAGELIRLYRPADAT
jgi:hypothetical protein